MQWTINNKTEQTINFELKNICGFVYSLWISYPQYIIHIIISRQLKHIRNIITINLYLSHLKRFQKIK